MQVLLLYLSYLRAWRRGIIVELRLERLQSGLQAHPLVFGDR